MITLEELEVVHETLEEHKGQKLRFTDFVPASLSDRTFTEQQLIEQGWFPNETF